MVDYEAALYRNASWKRANCIPVTDQDQPEEVFGLFPARPDLPPLAIVGGMGPLAGAQAFRKACGRFQDSRALVLYQACSLPDRSTVILGEDGPDTPLCYEIALRLADAVRLAVDHLGPPPSQPARCIIACNSAHYFWPLVARELRQTTARPREMQMISLVDSSLQALRSRSSRRTLLLATEGARAGKVFSAPCLDAGIVFDEPSPAQSRLLTGAIFEGVKSLDPRRAVQLGNEFFETILRSGRDYDCVLAGCTELAPLIDLLRRNGSPGVTAFLSRVTIVDPVEEALRHA
jgi:aspartate/glutamate racemase